ncbi:MAG: enoyl-CoA hydratase/isomerase family protein, partial [Bdellovibrionota bacterium]
MEIKIKKVLFGEQKFGAKSVGFIELNHAPALNALDTEMLADIEKRLLVWQNDPAIALVVFHSENPKAFCAGGDVKKLVIETREKGLKIAEDFFTQEYFTDCLVHGFKKPILAWLDGITMGGGVGLTQGASHRVVTEKTLLSMPEVFIGRFPDVGATGFLPQLKDGFGYFIGLSGARLSGQLGYETGWQNYFLKSDKKRKVFSDLLRIDWRDSSEENREILNQYLTHMMSLEAETEEKSDGRPRYSEGDQKLLSHWQKISSEFKKALADKNFAGLVECINKTEGVDGRARSIL